MPSVIRGSDNMDSAVAAGLKAWVNFNGVNTPPTIRDSYNVSSVTRNATGDYTINFSTAFASTNYLGTCMVSEDTASGVRSMIGPYGSAPTTSAFRVATYAQTTLINAQYVQIAFFE